MSGENGTTYPCVRFSPNNRRVQSFIMNRFKYVSSKGSWCQLKRLQSSVTQIQIPPRIERGPTDILTALESTIPKDGIRCGYTYHDDPFLFPTKKQQYRLFALSYESGKRTAMWIHKEHKNLFPKHLSEPPIQAFKPPLPYVKKSQVSEKLLLQAISEYRLADAVCIYELLETDVSNTTKQALLEMLCFYSTAQIMSKEFPNERWYTKPQKFLWQHNPVVQGLYEFLTKQDPETAALAHNAMLCGLAKYSRKDETSLLFEKCKQENIPLNVTTYNHVITAFMEVSSKRYTSNIDTIYDILKTMNEKGIKPNVRTLNAVLKIIQRLPQNIAGVHMKHICKEFEKFNIKYSLASYYHIMNIIALKGPQSYNEFMKILHTVSKESFVLQDPDDVKFFSHAMYIAAFVYSDRKAGDMIHEILFTNDNFKFNSDNLLENTYYSTYMTLILSTSTTSEFFEVYDKLVPNIYIPTIHLYTKIIKELTLCERNNKNLIAQYVAKIWSDVIAFGYANTSLKLSIILLMKIDKLPADSPLRSVFMDAAWDCWNTIKSEIENKPETYNPVETAATGFIAMTLLCGDRINEGIEVLTYTIEHTHLFIPTMGKDVLHKLFETCISKQCITGALLVLEYSINFGFPNVTNMAKEIYNLPQLTNIERNKLINLIGEENLNTLDVSKSQ